MSPRSRHLHLGPLQRVSPDLADVHQLPRPARTGRALGRGLYVRPSYLPPLCCSDLPTAHPADNCDKELVIAALGGIGSVLQLQSATPRSDFCRVLIHEGLEDPLSAAVLNITRDRDEGAEEAKTQVLAVLLLFSQMSQSDKRIQTAFGKRRIIKRPSAQPARCMHTSALTYCSVPPQASCLRVTACIRPI
jgi:hypothetical protein